MATFNQKHLSLAQRIIIQTGISNLSSLKSIANTIGKDYTTVKREIIRHRIFKPIITMVTNLLLNVNIIFLVPVRIKMILLSAILHVLLFSCKIRDKTPIACNGCKSLKSCLKDNFIYDAKAAEANYEATLSDSRLVLIYLFLRLLSFLKSLSL